MFAARFLFRLRVPLILCVTACTPVRERQAPNDLGLRESREARLGALVRAYQEEDPAFRALFEDARADPVLAAALSEFLLAEHLRAWQEGAATDERGSPARPWLLRLGEHSAARIAALLGVGNGYGPAVARDLLLALEGRAVKALVGETLPDRPSLVRAQAVALLGELEGPGTLTPAVLACATALATDPDWLVRREALPALARLTRRGGDPAREEQALAILSRALLDEDPAVGLSAIQALATLGNKAAIPALINHLERTLRGTDLARVRTLEAALEALTGMKGHRTPAEWRALLATSRGN